MSSPSGRQFELVHGDQEAVVVEVGGGLRSYTVAGREVLDGYGVDEVCPSGRGQTLIPWPNRIEDGRYELDGRSHQLPLNEPERSNAIHGLVRWSAWTAADVEPGRVVLEHRLHPQPGYPFSLALTAEYTLSDDGLTVRTTATNAGADPCPYGAGAHPYLTVGTATVDSTILQVRARTALQSDERGLPVGKGSVDGTELDFRAPRAVGDARLDHCLGDLERDGDGRARIELAHPDTDERVTVWLDDGYSYVMLFTGDPLPDVARRSLAVEPMTCPPNAFRTGEDLIRLEPGSSFASAWGISPTSSRRGDAGPAPRP